MKNHFRIVSYLGEIYILCRILTHKNILFYTDSVDTKAALEAMRDMITAGNVYMDNKRKSNCSPDRGLLNNIAAYITKILRIFGAIDGAEKIGFPQADTQGTINVRNLVTNLTLLSFIMEYVLSLVIANFVFFFQIWREYELILVEMKFLPLVYRYQKFWGSSLGIYTLPRIYQQHYTKCKFWLPIHIKDIKINEIYI